MGANSFSSKLIRKYKNLVLRQFVGKVIFSLTNLSTLTPKIQLTGCCQLNSPFYEQKFFPVQNSSSSGSLSHISFSRVELNCYYNVMWGIIRKGKDSTSSTHIFHGHLIGL